MSCYKCPKNIRKELKACQNCECLDETTFLFEDIYTKICRVLYQKRHFALLRFVWFLKKHGIVGFVFKTIIIGTITAIIGGFVANLWIDNYNYKMKIRQQEEMLDTLAIGISEEYVSSILGIPLISHIDENGMTDCYYVMDGTIIRILYWENVLNAYFITITDNNRTYEIKNRCYDFVLGEDTYADFPEPVTAIESKNEGSGNVHFYGEIRNTGRRNVFNYPVLATIQYGADFGEGPGIFIETAYTTIIDYYGFENIYTMDFCVQQDKEGIQDILGGIDEERKSIRPNTYGEIGGEYAMDIRILDRYPGWINITQILG